MAITVVIIAFLKRYFYNAWQILLTGKYAVGSGRVPSIID